MGIRDGASKLWIYCDDGDYECAGKGRWRGNRLDIDGVYSHGNIPFTPLHLRL